jgi:hypothetical protein
MTWRGAIRRWSAVTTSEAMPSLRKGVDMGEHLVVEGFGDFTEGLESCECVKVVARFSDEEEAIKFCSDHYEASVFGEDADGFSMNYDSRMSFFVLVRNAEELAI